MYRLVSGACCPSKWVWNYLSSRVSPPLVFFTKRHITLAHSRAMTANTASVGTDLCLVFPYLGDDCVLGWRLLGIENIVFCCGCISMTRFGDGTVDFNVHQGHGSRGGSDCRLRWLSPVLSLRLLCVQSFSMFSRVFEDWSGFLMQKNCFSGVEKLFRGVFFCSLICKAQYIWIYL